MNQALLTSQRHDYETPAAFYEHLDSIWHFDLDAAASAANAKCSLYFTKEDDGLEQDWGGHVVWCNPPYGRSIGKWVRKAYEEAKKPGTTVVMLIPARTDTAWFHDYARKGYVHFLRGRLRFEGCSVNAPFPSMLVIFGGQM